MWSNLHLNNFQNYNNRSSKCNAHHFNFKYQIKKVSQIVVYHPLKDNQLQKEQLKDNNKGKNFWENIVQVNIYKKYSAWKVSTKYNCSVVVKIKSVSRKINFWIQMMTVLVFLTMIYLMTSNKANSHKRKQTLKIKLMRYRLSIIIVNLESYLRII